MTLKQSRWVKLYDEKPANHYGKVNVMDIVTGKLLCHAEAIYTVRSYRKAAYWTLEYLESAGAANLVQKISESVMSAVPRKGFEAASVDGDGWLFKIERLNKNAFRVRLTACLDAPQAVKKTRGKKVA